MIIYDMYWCALYIRVYHCVMSCMHHHVSMFCINPYHTFGLGGRVKSPLSVKSHPRAWAHPVMKKSPPFAKSHPWSMKSAWAHHLRRHSIINVIFFTFHGALKLKCTFLIWPKKHHGHTIKSYSYHVGEYKILLRFLGAILGRETPWIPTVPCASLARLCARFARGLPDPPPKERTVFLPVLSFPFLSFPSVRLMTSEPKKPNSIRIPHVSHANIQWCM